MILFFLPPAFLDNIKPVVNIYIQDRERYERHINPTFSSPSGKNRADLFSRLRVGADYNSGAKLSARLEYQNSSDLFWTANLNGSTDNSDVLLGYAKYSTGGADFTGGRQKILLGEERLIGSTEWLSLSRSFDAGRIQSGQWDGWAGRLGVANNKPETARIEDLTHTDKNWGTTSFIEKHDLGTASGIDIQTLDHFVSHKFFGIDFSAEGAVQYGSNNGRDQRAWAYHAKASRLLPCKTTLSVEGDASSGGGDANTSRTFDNLYPSNHGLYGLADSTGWKNMNHLGVLLDHPMNSELTLRAGYHAFSLRDNSDAWYSATGAVNFKDPTGASGGDLGQEFDFEAVLNSKHCGTLSAGIALFNPGRYVQNVSGNSNQMTYGYLQWQLKF